jgi:ABC-type nitrate/sulfonate/bicarbonate transport system substrate-binding protein
VRRAIVALLFVLVTAAGCGGASTGDGDLTPINVSYQPALYWSLPYYIASEEGWWEEMGLEPSFTTFASGAPQVAASAADDWDVGGAGSAPALLGAARYDLLTIGITNDESAANVMVARPEEASSFAESPASLQGRRILLTTNSTGEYAVHACLENLGVSPDDVESVNLGQGEIISAFNSGEGDLAGVWAPNNYTLEEQTGTETVCTGEEAGVTIPGAHIVRNVYAEENPELVARYLAVYLHAQEWMRSNPEETIEYMEDFYREGGVIISEEYMQREIDTRPTFTLQEQLDILRSENGLSQAGQWFTGIGEYMQSTGTLEEVPDPQSFITAEYMEMIESDPELSRFATSAEG